MRLLYSLAIAIYTFAIRLASIWNEKARLMVDGWRRTQQALKQWPSHDTTVWFHASSMGEFEQARPVLEQYKEQHPNHTIVVTFFSPSGYEVRKNYPHADHIFYLPMDSQRNARRWVETVHPQITFFVKYDFWFNYMHQLKRHQCHTYLFSAIFRPQQYFFQWYGGWFCHQLNCFDQLFVQNQESLNLLQEHGIPHCSKAGDTRFDQVNRIAQNTKSFPEIEQFINDRPVLMAGSSWEPDEQHIKYFIDHYPNDLCVILAPHVISESHLQFIEQLYGNNHCLRYSQIKQQITKFRKKGVILIIDNIGMLSSLYRYAHVAYIGGGFGKGIHNTLEALTFGKPVCFGPNYHIFQEARDIIQRGGGFTYQQSEALSAQLTQWFDDPISYNNASTQSRQYVEENLGASKQILDLVEQQTSAIPPTKTSQPTHRPLLLFATLLLIASLFSSCSIQKYMGPDDYLLTHNKYKVITDDGGAPDAGIQEALKNVKDYTVQNPNSSILGLYRHKMHVYCLSRPSDSSWVHRYLRKHGQPPVIYDENAALNTTRKIEGLLQSKGCFESEVRYDTVLYGNRRVKVYYTILPSQRYTINEITYKAQSESANQFLQRWSERSLLHTGDYYDQQILSDERSAIAEQMHREGFYYASKDLVTYKIDTNLASGQLNIELNLGNPIIFNSNNQAQTIPLRPYLIDRIFVYPNSTAASSIGLADYDTLNLDISTRLGRSKYFFVYNQPMTLKPTTIARSMTLYSDRMYSSIATQRSYNALQNLRNFKYINFDFIESPNSSSHPDSIGRLDARVRLMNSTKQKLSLSLEVNNSSPNWISSEGNTSGSSGNFGVETILSYQNKNIFGGAELLKVEGSFLIELPDLFKPSSELTHWSTFETGIDASLDIPRLLLPSAFRLGQRTKPHTVLGLGAYYQDRYYFERLLINTSFGYNWSSNRRHQHQFLPIELTFARFFDIDPSFWARIEQSSSSSRLKYQYSSHFIMDARYDYVYSNQSYISRRDFTYLHFSFESAGNLLYGLAHTFQTAADSTGIYQVYGVPFSQYVRLNSEIKHYFYIGNKSSFVTRLLLGIGLPYGNSDNLQMPYEKSFFGGGPLTMRAWHLRRLGPGFYSPSNNQLLERTGDMTMVFNLEGRFPIFSRLEGALFADIGNVWLIYENESMPGGEFHFNTFIPSLAVGTGLGLRLNVSILTVRLDIGLPLYDPAYAETERWRYQHWDEYPLSIREGYFGPLTFNFGIDYPF